MWVLPVAMVFTTGTIAGIAEKVDFGGQWGCRGRGFLPLEQLNR